MQHESFPEKFHRLQSLTFKLGGELSGPIKGFTELHQKSLKDGALSKKIKELMALSISIVTHCDGCVAYHVHDSLKAGATREEVLEAIGVAVMMGGGPGLIYGCEALEALNQFEKQLEIKQKPNENTQSLS